ncbi:uncharacterized protein LOC129905874 [Episyrphus balteatus]|uniref:uncharacterized protein LOC129905874 n=1 Tax=Episyrphus balteatus TaxID=286459 RepID=UPI00248688ED|nr:uncharacterized protein LOC129905874 [Episyrphus balteatus]
MRLILWLIFGLVQLSIELDINITKFDNCFEYSPIGEEWPIEIQEVHYDFNDDGYIDHIYGKYLVRSIDTRDKELTIMVYKCSIDDPPPCEHKIEHVITELHCDKFRNDASGIWHMVSQAMSGSTCGHEMGLFDFELPRINHDYFMKHLTGVELNSRYRMILLFHKKSDESTDRRACAEIQFDVFN